MRTIPLSTAASLLLFAVVAFTPLSAVAMPLRGPAGISALAASSRLLEPVYCRRVWSCGNWGCGWHNLCWRNGEDWRRAPGSDEDWRWMRGHRP